MIGNFSLSRQSEPVDALAVVEEAHCSTQISPRHRRLMARQDAVFGDVRRIPVFRKMLGVGPLGGLTVTLILERPTLAAHFVEVVPEGQSCLEGIYGKRWTQFVARRICLLGKDLSEPEPLLYLAIVTSEFRFLASDLPGKISRH